MSCDGQLGLARTRGRQPPGARVLRPGRHVQPLVDRQAANAYGTGSILPGRIYPLEGNRFVPGFDPAHLGGDIWSADAAIKVIENDPGWRGMLVSLGGIDKLGHMWGPEDEQTGPPGSDRGDAASAVHRQERRQASGAGSMHALKHRGLLDETLIVVTADHAAQTGRPVPRSPRHLPAWRSGQQRVRSGHRLDRPAVGLQLVLRRGRGRGLPRPEPGDRAIQGRLVARGRGDEPALLLPGRARGRVAERQLAAKKRQAADAALDLPGVIASYRLNDAQNDYRLFGTNRMSGAEKHWFAGTARSSWTRWPPHTGRMSSGSSRQM